VELIVFTFYRLKRFS